jgi:cytidylate kinase
MTLGSAEAPLTRKPRLITVSAAYGAGGSVVAPALAARLRVPFLQWMTTGNRHAAPMSCEEQISLSEEQMTPVHRVLGSLTQAMPAGPTQSPPSTRHQRASQRRSAETEIRDLVQDGGGVVLGRAAAVVLGAECGFHVRLDGPSDGRIIQGALIEGISPAKARVRMRAADHARSAYVRRLYHADPRDSALYHMTIDSTAVPLDTVIELIFQAFSAYLTAESPNPTMNDRPETRATE